MSEARVNVVELTKLLVCNRFCPERVKNAGGKYENTEFPYLGTDEERKMYVLYFNEKLKEKCAEYGYVFFDVYDKYVDVEGFLDEELSDGNSPAFTPGIIQFNYVLCFAKDAHFVFRLFTEFVTEEQT